jgi:cytochrome c oxidase subunit 2
VIAAALISTRQQYDWLFSIYVPIAAGVFAVVMLAVLAATLRYRRRAGDGAGDGARRSENNPLEATYALVLAATAAFLLYLTFTAEHRVDTVANRERPRLTVDVTAAKWEWQFSYRGRGIVLRAGAVGRQPLVVPTDQAVRLDLSSVDVIHSLWIPELRFKRDLIPGTTELVTLTFTRPGLFSGQCAEFCGLRHADMVFRVRALAPAAFAQWIETHHAASS